MSCSVPLLFVTAAPFCRLSDITAWFTVIFICCLLEMYGLGFYNVKMNDDVDESDSVSEHMSFKLNIFTILCLSGALVFQLKKRPPDYQGRKGRKVDDKGFRGKDGSSSLPPEKLPYLVELSPGRTTPPSYRYSCSACVNFLIVNI